MPDKLGKHGSSLNRVTVPENQVLRTVNIPYYVAYKALLALVITIYKSIH